MKKIAVFLALLVALAVINACAAGFEKTNTYTDGQFTDVPAAEWYAKEVKSTYELGLMNGIGGGLFDPEAGVTVAEAITMAARASAKYNGEEIASADGEWYTMYVNYAIAKGFVKDGQFDNFDRPAKRYEVASLFENAMPDGYFTAKNAVDKIPDVSEKQSYHDDLLNLYKAGVVMGSDSYGNFRPEDNITRAEAAAIINRVALPENRPAKTLDKISDDDAYTMIITENFTGTMEGINSGWVLDNRGATPRTTLTAPYSSLFDIDNTAPSAFIREFNKTETGVFDLYTTASAKGDGVYLEFRNDNDKSVYRVITKDGKWNIVNADGTLTAVSDFKEGEKQEFHIRIDLDNKRSTTYIDDTLCGTYPLIGEANLYNFRFATTEECVGSLTPGFVYMYANYPVFEKFNGSDMPKNWTALGDVSVSDSLKICENSGAVTSFSPVSGKVVTEFIMLLPEKESMKFYAKSGAKNVIEFSSDDSNFYVNGTKVYENYLGNMWYIIRTELDTDTGNVLVKLNGRKVAEVDVKEKATSIDNITFVNESATAIMLDDVKVYRLMEHDDYVPVPVKPEGADDYIIGMNVCSLWTNGTHYGWSCISAYSDNEPVLGYYDEGNPETADWEIKYLVEHGIDFQAFCVFFGTRGGAQRLDAGHLYNGYMNAKYSDMSNYCIIWEAGNGGSPASVDEMKNFYAPYIIEYFFKDSRYMVIDNQPVVCVFGADKYATKIGGNAKMKEAFDVLEDEAKKLGFDGVIFLVCGKSSQNFKEMGFDGCYAYNWGVAGYQANINKEQNLSSASNDAVYTVPTVSVGFNNIAWSGNGIRNPMMSFEDYKEVNEWVRDEYIPTYAKEDWQKNFLMLSTWNEYGEGTYIMPTADERGFGYLDTIREVYTDAGVDEKVNTVPTEAQKYRINHLYPQYRRLLRLEGYVNEVIDGDDLETVYTVDYSTAEAKYWSTSNPVKDKNGVTGVSSNGDPIVIIQSMTGKDRPNLSDIDAVRINATLPKGSTLEFFYITEKDKDWNQTKSYMFPATEKDGEVSLFVPADKLKSFAGKLIGLRIDPLTFKDGKYTLKSVEFLAFKEGKAISKEMSINGNELNHKLNPERGKDGEMFVAFDPSTGMDFLLNTYYVWDKKEGVLTLNFKEHTVVYTVGSDKYLLDGKEKSIGTKLASKDGLPMIPMKKLCEDVGYEFNVDKDGAISIKTDLAEYFEDIIAAKKAGNYEFNITGDTENWNSRFMSLAVSDGFMSCDSNSTSKDPTLLNKSGVSLRAEKYIGVEFRIRYAVEDTTPLVLQLFFHTNKSPGDAEAKSVKIPLEGNNTGDEWVVVSASFKDVATWKDTITCFRLDPFNASGHMDIDYIRFIEDPDYIDLETADPMTLPFTLDNPDAEGKENGFSNTQIVKDPDNDSNKCYMVVSRAGSATYAYARQGVYFKPGYTYQISYRVRLASHGGRTDLDPSKKFEILNNMIYSDPNQTNENHVVKRNIITLADGWVDVSFEFTVDAESDDRSLDTFSFYADPKDGEEVGYYFDDIKVTEMGPEK